MRRRGVAGLIVAGVAAAVAVGGLTSARPAAAAGPAVVRTAAPVAPAIRWAPCTSHVARGDYCGTLSVPIDYGQPAGRHINLALIKQPAGDPARRIGSLLVNPGGPGGSGVDIVAQAGHALLTSQVRARFDLIGFDPRGIGRSAPLRCFTSADQLSASFTSFAYPTTDKQDRRQYAADDVLRSACAANGGAILDHMATADVARDMDTIRRAVGDARLNYYGLSYGSYLGDTYANLFPDKVRSLVIDGVLNPVAWSGTGEDARDVPITTRLRSAVGSAAGLDEFFRLCDAGPANCSFAPHAAARYAALYHSLSVRPVVINYPKYHFHLRYDEKDLLQESVYYLYDSLNWPDFAAGLVDLEHRVARRSTAAIPAPVAAGRARLGRVSSGLDQFVAVACSDSINPDDRAAWPAAAGRYGLFGPLWTWSSSACAGWPGHDDDRYLGPFAHRTSDPVLVVGNLYDPATPYQGAQAAARLLPNSRLLTVHGWGHTSLFLSRCATAAISRYLLTTTTPAAGTVCQQDSVPFAQPATASATTSARAALVPLIR